ncbi:MAG: flavin reductase family protein [Candidatus Omnitrophica bacterium]|nr:flavin reductase family protein [Candidatus Omnitrophota bacterium]
MKKSLGAQTILYPAPVWVIGTYDQENKPNVMTASWAGICCSSPPCVSVSLRKATYTFGNITERKAFTVNIPSKKYVQEADYFGLASGKNVNKLSATALTPVKSSLVDAPYIEEFPLVIECKLLHTLEIGLHTLFVGEIIDVKSDEAIIGKNSMPDMEKLKTFLFSPGDRKYYKTGAYLAQAFSAGKEKKGTRNG